MPDINFLNHQHAEAKAKKAPLFKFFFYPVIFLAIFIFIFTFEVVLSGEGIVANIEKMNIFQNLTFTFSNKLLSGEESDRINILLMGIGGAGHDGPYLTDTMILVSVKPSTGKVSMISIPRDLSVPIPGYGWRKINEADSFGQVKTGNGAILASEVVSNTFGVPINYYVRVDFSGFEKLIDELGGVDINVDTAFSDSSFPTDNYGVQTVSFKSGWQKMNGETALNFVRSRHGNNGESSDFARSRRQQKLLAALKDKAFSFTTFMSYSKINALYNMYKNNVATNLQPWEMYKFYRLAKNLDNKDISNTVLDDSSDSLLFASNINGAYMLLPKDMSFGQLRNLANNILGPSQPNQQNQQTQQIQPAAPIKVGIKNGTKIEGLAYRTSVELKSDGFTITKIANADKQNYEKTIIVDLTNGQKQDKLNELKDKLKADIASQKPDWLNLANEDADFIIILGQDQQTLSKLD